MKIIDLHSHFNIGSPFDCSERPIHKRNRQWQERSYEFSGIVAGVFCPYSSVSRNPDSVAWIHRDNEEMNRLAEQNAGIYQWAVLHPERKELFGQAEKLIAHPKVLGIKLHPYYHGYSMEQYGNQIFSFCNALKCFVLVHPHPGKTMELVRFANKYPDMKMIIAHLGLDSFDAGTDGCDRINAILQAENGNVFTDTSAHGTVFNNIVELAVEKAGSEKIFFGTDTYSCGYEVGRILFAGIDERDKENILYRNAKNNFQKQFQNI